MDNPISLLPAGAPAQGTDLVPAARAGANVKLSVSDLQSGMLAGLANVTPAALSDALTIVRAGVAKNITLQDALNALGLVSMVTPGALTDEVVISRAGITKTMFVSDLLSTLTLLSSITPPVGTDEMLLDRGGSAGKVTLAQLATYMATAAATGGQRRNLVINGAFDIAQRGTSYAATTVATFGCVDRWYMSQGATAQSTFSQTSTGGLQGFGNCLKVLLTGTSAAPITFGTLFETIDVTKYQGRTINITIRAIKGSTWNPPNLGVKVITGTGTDQGLASLKAGTWTGQANAVNTTVAPAAAWATYTVPNVAIPSSCTELALEFSATPTGAAVDANSFLQITGVEIVDSAQAMLGWEPRPLAQELELCQRYLPVFQAVNGAGGDTGGFGQAISATQAIVGFDLKTRPRSPITGISVNAVGSFYTRDAAGNPITLTGLAFRVGGLFSVEMTATVAAGLVAGNASKWGAVGVTNGQILFNGAELL